MRRILLAGLLLVAIGTAVFFVVIDGRPRTEPLVILVGVDGLRYDALDRLKPPTLSRMAAEGVRVERMTASFPTLTFPNFYTLATGLYPEHHGIIGNNMFDPEWRDSFSLGAPSSRDGRWWEGEPLWVTAQRQGVRAACMFWPGSEAEIGGVRPWQWRPFDKAVTPEARVKTVLDWLALPPAERPRLTTIYFHEVDTASHRFGAESDETAAAVKQVDAALAELLAGIERLGLGGVANVIVVSDHGMTAVSPDRAIPLSELAGSPRVQVDFSGAVAGLRPPAEEVDAVFARIAAKQEHFRIYRREEVPERLHFRAHRRIPPLVLVADEGWMLIRRPLLNDGDRHLFQAATHGFDPALESMGATFVARGPAFPRGRTIPPFENIHVYPLVCAILGLKPAPCDGDDRLVKAALSAVH